MKFKIGIAYLKNTYLHFTRGKKHELINYMKIVGKRKFTLNMYSH